MAWLGEGLSTLKGQITSFTKEVLSEGREENCENSSDFKVTKKKVEELEALCASQDLEILELRQRNAELQRQLVITGLVAPNQVQVENEDLVDVELCCDGPSNGGYFHEQAAVKKNSINGLEAYDNAKREFEEKTNQVERLTQELDKLQSEKNLMNERCNNLEEQVTNLSEQLESACKVQVSELEEVEQLRSQLKAATEQLAETKDGNSPAIKQQLEVAEKKVEELEKELQKVHQQLLDNVNDTQANASELKDAESRKQLLQDSGAQKTELLRARQDMVNRIIQMGEKSREVEMNVKKLQKEGKHLSADVAAIICKLGDPEQQELMYDALNALELENQVLKLRNSQLEMSGCAETLKANNVDSCNKFDSTCIDNENKSSSIGNMDQATKLSEADATKHYDTVEGKREKHSESACIECEKLQKVVSDINMTKENLQEEKSQLHQEKITLSSEIEAMAKIVQDLEAQLARALEENSTLSTNLEELDRQHQAAIDQMLKVKQLLQTQNENLQAEVTVVKKKLKAKELEEKETRMKKKVAQKTTATQNEHQNWELAEKELIKNFEKDLEESLDKLITFEIPKEYVSVNNINKDNKYMVKIEALVKMCVEYRWKKDTLERKVAELMKELRESKDAFERRDMEAKELNKECATLKGNVDSLIEELITKHGGGEGLAPIPENSEEIELLEQKIQLLENEIGVLKEARSNLEADAEKMREENQDLLKRLQNATAIMRNQENLEREVNKWQEAANVSSQQLQEILQQKTVLENDKMELRNKVYMLEATVASHDEIEKVAKQRLQEALEVQTRLQDQVKFLQEKEKNAEELYISYQQKLKEIEDMKNTLKNVEEDARSEKFANTELTSIIKQYQDELRKYEEEDLKVQDDYELLKNKYNNNKNALTDMEKKCEDALEQLKLSHQEKMKEIEDLKTSIQNAEEQAKKEKLISVELNNVIQQYKDQLHQYEKEKKEAISIQNEYKMVMGELSESAKALSFMEKKCEDAYAELDYKDSEITKWKVAHDEMEKQFMASVAAKNEIEQSYQNILKLGLNLEDLEASVREVEKWKQVAKATERQLDEALQARAELEQECGRLFAIESKVHKQEHLQQEVARLNSLSENLEQQLDQLSKEKDQLEQHCETLRMKLNNQQNVAEESLEKCIALEEKLNITIYNKEEVQRECERLREAEEQWRNIELKYKHDILEAKRELEGKSDMLLAVEAKLKTIVNSEGHYKEKVSELEEKLKQMEENKVQLEQDYQSLKIVSETYRKKEEEAVVCYKRDPESSDHMVISNLLQGGSTEELAKLEEHIQNMQVEKDNILAILDEKTRENSVLKVENNRLMQMIAEEKFSISKLQGDHQVQLAEQSNMAKETIANLSKIIKDKDLEIDTFKQKCDSLLSVIQQTSLNNGNGNEEKQALVNEIKKLCNERDELIRTVQVKHSESVQYHNEIQRLGAVLSQEVKRSEDIKLQFSDLVQHHELKQKMLSEAQNELSVLKQIIQHAEEISKKGVTERDKTDSCTDGVRNETASGKNNTEGQGENVFEACFQQLRAKDNIIQMLQKEVKKLTEMSNVCSPEVYSNQAVGRKSISNENMETVTELTTPEQMKQKIEALQVECASLTDNLLQEQTRNKYLQNEVQEQYEKESALLKELERLRQHLMGVEESYTLEALKAEEQMQDLKNKLVQAEERIKNSSTAYTSASIRANQHVESLQDQARLIALQRDEIQQKLSVSEDQVQRHVAALRNLQAVLEQFQKDREREIAAATAKFQQELKAAEMQREELVAEINSLKKQVTEANEALNAASRLGEQLDRKYEIIESLKEEGSENEFLAWSLDAISGCQGLSITSVCSLSNRLQEAELQAKSANLTVEGKVDRSLVKNLILGYFIAPQNNRNEVLRIVATVLDFSQEERNRIGLEAGVSSSWFKSLLNPGKGQGSTQSLSEAFVRFLEQESRPQPQLRLLPETGEILGGSRSESPSSTASGSQRRSPLLLAEVQLPTFTQFPVSRSSSSILKDVLKES